MRTIMANVFLENGEFSPAEVYIDGDRIIEISNKLKEDLINNDSENLFLIPGLIDIHSHGGFGYDTCTASQEELVKMAELYKKNGITSVIPTTMTLPFEKLQQTVANISKAALETSVIKGIDLEGPFIAGEKAGAQSKDYICAPSEEFVRELDRTSGGLVKYVTIAPECEGALNCIENLSKNYIVSLGHTAADYETSLKAFKAGAGHVTHLYNAMNAYGSREPGLIGAAMDSENVYVELISDGIHIHPSVVRNTFRMFDVDKIILISDSMEATGLGDGEYELGGQKVFVKGKCATLSNGTIAGSVSTLFDCLKKAVSFGVPMVKAIKAATMNPARELGIYHEVGSIAVGKKSDLLLIDKNFNIVDVIA